MNLTQRPRAIPSTSGRLLLAGCCVLWLAGVGWGMKQLLDRDSAPGVPAAAPAQWPVASSIARRPGVPTLVLLLHPHCPCTRATLGELSRVVARTRGRFAIEMLFVVPNGKPASWAIGRLWRSSTDIPGAHVTLDPEGREARRFGAFTSGQALYYDARGQLRFSGGITPGRGNSGDNAGADAVVALATFVEPVYHDTPVFGCPLAAPEKQLHAAAPVCAP
jgi:hypothetical protein